MKIRKEKRDREAHVNKQKQSSTKWWHMQHFHLLHFYFDFHFHSDLHFDIQFNFHTHLSLCLQEEGYQSDQAVGMLTAQKQQEVGTPDMVKLSRRRYEESRTPNPTQLSE